MNAGRLTDYTFDATREQRHVDTRVLSHSRDVKKPNDANAIKLYGTASVTVAGLMMLEEKENSF